MEGECDMDDESTHRDGYIRSSIPRRSSTSSVELVEIDIDTIDLVSLMIRGTGN